MRYAILSDIHGNLEAFRAVLAALDEERIGRYLFLGDVVGYGADPAGCIKLLKSLSPEALIAGNHEWGVLGLLGREYFNVYARAAVEWTKTVLLESDMDYLRSFKLLFESEDMTLVHGSLESPKEFHYIFNDADARATMKSMKSDLCFVGHTHVAGIFNSDDNKKRIVNAGSIGQPRDRDPRASFVVYDDSSGAIELKRTEYDIKTAQNKILKAGLPKELAFRLSAGQ